MLIVLPFASTKTFSGGSLRRIELAKAAATSQPSECVVLHTLDERGRELLAEKLGCPVSTVELGTRVRSAALRSWCTHIELPFTLAQIDPSAARERIAQLAQRLDPDVVWCGGIEAWHVLPYSLRQRAVVDLIDLPSLNQRAIASALTRRLARRVRNRGRKPSTAPVRLRQILLHTDAALRSRALERRVADQARSAVLSSAAEQRQLPEAKVIPNGSPANTEPSDLAPTDVPRLIFPGQFRYAPNQDGAEWFVDAVLPEIRRSACRAPVVLAGSSPPTLADFGAYYNVEVTGYVDDFSSVFNAEDVVVVPLRSGSGTRIKIIEAWARGLPVVSTSKGAEGLPIEPDVNIVIADDGPEFARRCVELASSPTLRRSIGEGGRSTFGQGFSWAHSREQLTRLLRAAAT